MQVLIVEDNPALRNGLAQAVVVAGHDATCVADGLHADTLLATEAFDLLILDLGLPGLDGLDVLARLRTRDREINRAIPVLVLSARSTMDERVRGLDRGADDYLTKPFDLSEFDARVRALLRHGKAGLLKLGRLEWDWDNRQGRIGEELVVLSPHEITVIEHLLRKTGRIVSKASLAHVIGDEGIAADNKVEVYIHRLRKKLSSAEVEIRNVRGLGYLVHAGEAL